MHDVNFGKKEDGSPYVVEVGANWVCRFSFSLYISLSCPLVCQITLTNITGPRPRFTGPSREPNLFTGKRFKTYYRLFFFTS